MGYNFVNIAVLSSINDPSLGFNLKELLKDYNINSIIFDSKKWDNKDLEIWNERTLGKFPKIELWDINKSIPFYYFNNHNSSKVEKFIVDKKIDLMINLGTPRILRNNILSAPTIGILNSHPGILPDYRGCSCVEWALYNNDNVGNTGHLMTDKIDEGPIIYIEEINLSNCSNYQDIRIATYLNSIEVIKKSINRIINKQYDLINYPKGGKYYKPIDNVKLQKVINNYSN